jgi:hypothetical protein
MDPQIIYVADFLALLNAGNSKAISKAIMAITQSSSMIVNALLSVAFSLPIFFSRPHIILSPVDLW